MLKKAPQRIQDWARAVGRGISTWLAEIDNRQASWAARRLRPPAVLATIVVKSDVPLAVVKAELESDGWVVTDADTLPDQTYRLITRARLGQGKPGEVATHAATQLRLALRDHNITHLRVEALPAREEHFHLWGVSFTKEATASHRLAAEPVLRGCIVVGHESEARAEYGEALRALGIPDSAWKLVPSNSAAASAHPHLQPVAPVLQAVALLALSGGIAVLLGALLPPGWALISENGKTHATQAFFATIVVAAACFVAFAIRSRVRRRSGQPRTWTDVGLVLGITFIPLVPATTLLSGRVGVLWTIVSYVSLLVLTFIVVIFGRPAIWTARFSAKRTARNVVISVTAVVLVLNIPATAFAFGMGLPNLVGSIPIGTVVTSGILALGCAAVGVAGIWLTIRLLRRASGIPSTAVFCLWLSVIAGLGLFGIVATSYANGQSVATSGIYDTRWPFGLEPVCVDKPSDRQQGTYWLVGTVGRTSYLIPRFVHLETGASPIEVDTNHELTHTGFDDGCE